MLRTITRAEFARLGGVSKPAITKWLKAHPDAGDGTRVKLDHADVVAYLKSKGHEVAPPAPTVAARSDGPPTKSANRPKAAAPAPTRAPKGGQPKPRQPTALGPEEAAPAPAPRAPKRRHSRSGGDAPKPDENGFADELADLTLVQICARYGTVSAYKAHLEAFEKRERALKYRLENEEAEGRLVDRELVVRVVSAFDGANRKLLTDAPKTISRRLYAMRAAEDPVELAEATVHEIVSTIIKAVKKAVHEVIDGG